MFLCVEKHQPDTHHHEAQRLYMNVLNDRPIFYRQNTLALIPSAYTPNPIRPGISNDWRKIDDSSSGRRGYCITSATSAGAQHNLPHYIYARLCTKHCTQTTHKLLLFYYTHFIYIYCAICEHMHRLLLPASVKLPGTLYIATMGLWCRL